MSTYVVVGLQYGDEGKGKITDVLSAKSDYVVRFQGGNNAGHTVYVGEDKFVLHLLPSGVLQCKGKCVIANGVVVDPKAFISEIKQIEAKGLSTDHIFISRRAHVIMPYHILLDTYREEELVGEKQIGTTKKGIGPCYEDKIARVGIRMIDLLNPEVLAEKIKVNLKVKNSLFEKYFNKPTLDFDTIYNEFLAIGEQLKDRIVDTELEINEAIKDGKNILFEGAQALMLDIDFGTYPYVTSSSPSTGGVCTGAGVPPTALKNLIGVAKAYTTRVGNGPFPTELDNDLGEKIRQIGHEFGATTGRPRRTGWLDLVSLKHACMINGINNLVITKLDVLTNIGELKVATKYKTEDGKIIDYFTSSTTKLYDYEPIYETLEGWTEDITKARSYDELPVNAQKYIEFIEKYLGINVYLVSVGPERTQNIIRKELF
ncbi:adenylosuccinate synthase [Riemerella anatipestifer]|uniref:Adenylosuccinate synthetase n=1 Tax=Riemerella anatipestifer (strain ATCC 11845 / DSM 15868 / JCM 9532 / NCTC 11014) TaxID=693978 RepID=E4TBC4_RIEAD|nr:adenylosuccinate synthase [Riemerella anatipestifer]ADQ81428.1 Adenylosuccinate synthetase [Riemerella anatipestifer ATCC 11845 = DSM 15868]ADZ13075.1 Adenylosuccinate synthase [Riemerella anatipestifer RA-GD]AFD55442.1 adenylosuccinate synthetase [Riemerella anatipestifer ATCC 11845 = DSM 15868]AGC40676.1 Adenylosuccinate synthase [Riemerella anatipestifer RA-CH-2]AKP68706.1 adenylosuccinate synthetase [Riemerella anatipestifer]